MKLRKEHDPFVPRISCQACGESWPLKETITHDCTDSYSCPDCDYETVHPTGDEIRCGGDDSPHEERRLYAQAYEISYKGETYRIGARDSISAVWGGPR